MKVERMLDYAPRHGNKLQQLLLHLLVSLSKVCQGLVCCVQRLFDAVGVEAAKVGVALGGA